jgi:glycosyltransferase involved in cell wall biosynthesis
MRVAYLTGQYPRATDTFIQREVEALRSRGLDVVTLSVRRPEAKHLVGPEQQAEHERTHYLLPAGPLKLLAAQWRALRHNPSGYREAIKLAWRMRQPGVKPTLYQLFYFAEAALAADVLRDQKVDHLHNHFANSSCSLSTLAAAMAGVPLSFTMHGPAIFYEPKFWRIDLKIAAAKFVSTISHFCRSQAMAFSDPDHWGKLRIVHCGIDPAWFPPPEYDPGRHEGVGSRLLYVGRLAAVKGLPVLLDAMTRLPDAVRLTVVGDGEDRDWLERRTTELGLEGRVDFVGYRSQSQVREHLRQTDAFVMSSFAEGVPVVLMEALAAGVPVVATQIAGVPELVEHEVTGLLVSPGDAGALADAVGRLLDDPGLRTTLATAGRDRVFSEYDINAEAAWLAQLFRGESEIGQLRPSAPPPSQGGAGGGSGAESAMICLPASASTQPDPHPNPLPGRERGPEQEAAA